MDKKLKIGLILTAAAVGIYFLSKKNKKSDIKTSQVILPETEVLNSENEEYFLTHDKSSHILEFKENLKALNAIPKEIEINDIADSDFMIFVSQQFDDTNIADGDKLSVDFVKDFNIIIGKLIKADFKFKPNIKDFNYTDAETIKKGGRAKECEKLAESLNYIFGKKILDVKGNYTNELYDITSEIFKGTSIYNDENKDGRITKEFINNLYNLLNLNK